MKFLIYFGIQAKKRFIAARSISGSAMTATAMAACRAKLLQSQIASVNLLSEFLYRRCSRVQEQTFEHSRVSR